jgi:aryl-alcohol dehydrogenase-like predicted oxidoreductase
MTERDSTRPKPEAPLPLDRRDFLRLGAAAGAAVLTGGLASAVGAAPAPATSAARAGSATPAGPTAAPPMPTRMLGRTGHRVGLFSLGGQSALEQPDNEAAAVRLIDRALDLGVNYIDTAAAYGGSNRWSQRYIGQVMKRRRKEVFLASKTHDRTREGSWRLLEESLRLLNTDHLDLWQIHRLDEMDDVNRIFARGGAMEAMHEARRQGLVRHFGITGHTDPEVLIEAMRRFQFDNILMAINAADRHHLSFGANLLPLAVEQGMGIIGMKIPSRGRLVKSRGPLTMKEAVDYVLTLPVSTVIIGCDNIAQLEENVALAKSFKPLGDSAMAALSTRTLHVARDVLFYRRWA